MISYQGKLGALAAFPLVGQLVTSLDIPGLTAEVAAVLQASVTFTPPSLVGIAAVMAAITAAISAGFQPPVFDFAAALSLKYGLLKAKLDLILSLTGLLASGSLRVYEYDGQAGTFGSELATTLAGPDGDGGVPAASNTFAVVLLAEAGGPDETLLKALRGGV